MKSDRLFDAIGELPDEYVQDARPAAVLKRKVPWGVWAAAAACLVVAVLIAVPLLNREPDKASIAYDTKSTNEIAEESESAIAEGAGESEDLSGLYGGGPDATSSSGSSETYGDEPNIAPENKASELPAGALTKEEFEEHNLAFYAGVYGDEYTYEEYLADYANVTKNPVFDALLNGDGTSRFFASSVSAWKSSASSVEQTQNATVYVDGLSSLGSGPVVQLSHSGVHYEQDDEPFDRAAERGERTDYEIDGFEVQKYFGSDTCWARIMIDGDWYMAHSSNEAAIDETMAELAAIANQL